MTRPAGRGRGSAIWVAVVGMALASAIALSLLVEYDMNPTVFISVGEESGAIRARAEELLDDLVLRPDLGHDGRFFFVQGVDPWLLDPDRNASVLDRPVYRSQRVAYPALASAGGLLPPEGVVWGMLVVNLLAMGAGAYAAARIAESVGGSAWWGLAFPLNLGLISELGLGGAGVLATAAAFWAVLAVIADRPTAAGVLFAVSALAREVMLIAVVGCLLWLLREHRRKDSIKIATPAFATVGLWALYVRWVLPPEGTVVEGNFSAPFVGFLRNLPNWFDDPLEFAIGLITVLILVFYAIRSIRSPSVTAWTFLPFVPMAFMLGEAVWDGYFNLTRAVAPVLTAYFLITFAPRPAAIAVGVEEELAS